MKGITKYLVEPFLGMSLIIMSVLAFTQVLTRYVFQVPAVWIEETTRYFMVWLVFIGMAYAVPKNAHFVVGVVELIFPNAAKVIYKVIDYILVVFGIIFSGLVYKVVAFQFELGQKSTALGISMGIVYLGMLIGGVLFTLYQIEKIYQGIKDNTPEVSGEEAEF